MGRKKLLRWAVILGAGAAVVALGLMLGAEPSPEATGQTAAPARPSAAPQARGSGELALPSRDGLSRPRGNLFASNAPPPPPVKKKSEAEIAAEAPPAPVAPPMPYRVAGQVVHEGPPRVVLARDDRVYFVREGDVLDGGYRVESIKADGVTLVYTPLDMRQHLAAASSLAVPGAASAKAGPAAPAALADGPPAQLRWEGPASVQAGSEFEVALKITSERPVRGSPLQLSYDAKLLQPVSVRAGEFFAEGSFTYRVSPPGSIFVGASGKGEVPADAEFLVVTFKPIRAGATAELKLSSLMLQGLGGSAVGHAPLAAFRTSISQ